VWCSLGRRVHPSLRNAGPGIPSPVLLSESRYVHPVRPVLLRTSCIGGGPDRGVGIENLRTPRWGGVACWLKLLRDNGPTLRRKRVPWRKRWCRRTRRCGSDVGSCGPRLRRNRDIAYCVCNGGPSCEGIAPGEDDADAPCTKDPACVGVPAPFSAVAAGDGGTWAKG
jgi:hypothetical protein